MIHYVFGNAWHSRKRDKLSADEILWLKESLAI